MSVRVQLPACGGAVVFEVGSSMVAVCPYCRSAVARGDRSVENLGKVVDLVETGARAPRRARRASSTAASSDSPAAPSFKHEAGGVWDEWYAPSATTSGVGSPKPRAATTSCSRKNRIRRASRVPGTSIPANRSTSTRKPRGSSLPRPAPRRSTGPKARSHIASSPVPQYLVRRSFGAGRRVRHARLFRCSSRGVRRPRNHARRSRHPGDISREIYELRQVKAKKINCPNCGGPLDLDAPDKTERVGCPFCGSLSTPRRATSHCSRTRGAAVQTGHSRWCKGYAEARRRTVIGAFERSVNVEGTDYLLAGVSALRPARWLRVARPQRQPLERVKSVPIGKIDAGYIECVSSRVAVSAVSVRHRHRTGVIGECYWKVTRRRTELRFRLHSSAVML